MKKFVSCIFFIALACFSGPLYAGRHFVFENPSNCYIITAPGDYSFKAVKGNSTQSVGNVKYVALCWESSKGIIREITYDKSSHTIHISTPEYLQDGNAVVAALDDKTNILWSWHLWVCGGYIPEEKAQTYYKDSGTMMDRDLGALSATPGDAKSRGLYYQWGRKDPFPSPDQEIATEMKSSPVPAGAIMNNAIAFSIKYPIIFITTSGDETDWDLKGNTPRWESRDKSIYDPCPDGWRIPGPVDDVTIWAKASDHYIFEYAYNNENKGMDFSRILGACGGIWYPSTGSLDFNTGDIYMPGSGFRWSAVKENGLPCAFSFASYGTVRTMTPCNKAYGFSVRCMKEVKSVATKKK